MSDNRITINDVASALGISKTTVSRAISGKGRISEQTRAQVMEYIEKSNYRPSIIAKGLAEQRTYNIAVVWSKEYGFTELPFLQKCLVGINEVLSENGNDVLVCMCAEEDITDLERVISNRKVDGVILTRTAPEDKAAEYLKREHVPFVAIGSSEDSDITTVDNDNLTACKELTIRLIEKGIGRIGLLGGEKSSYISKARLGGYRAAFAEKGISLEEDILYYGIDSPEEAGAAIEELVSKGVSTVITTDDAVCSHVLAYCNQSEITIPDRLQIASYYDSRLLSNFRPPITALHFDDRELGRQAAAKLMSLVNDEEVEDSVLDGYRICMRASTL